MTIYSLLGSFVTPTLTSFLFRLRAETQGVMNAFCGGGENLSSVALNGTGNNRIVQTPFRGRACTRRVGNEVKRKIHSVSCRHMEV